MAEPDSPLSPLGEAAVQLHEWFLELMAAGFSEDQALRLIVGTMHANRGDDE